MKIAIGRHLNLLGQDISKKKISKIFLGGSFLAWLLSPVKMPKKHNFKNAIIKIVNQCQANPYHIKIPWLIPKWFSKSFAAKICLFGVRLHFYWAQFNLKMTRIFKKILVFELFWAFRRFPRNPLVKLLLKVFTKNWSKNILLILAILVFGHIWSNILWYFELNSL